MHLRLSASLWLAGTLGLPAGDVIINEIMYHPPAGRDDGQFIELHNRGTAEVDLSGWSFTKGVTYTFPATKLAPGGLLVVSQNPTTFRTTYTNVEPLGPFTGRLKHSGERLELADASGQTVDSVKFADRAPWPVSPDGAGASLERLSPTAPSDEVGNWAASALRALKAPGGTPGRTNSVFSANLPPLITAVKWSAAEPGKPIVLSATVADADGLKTVVVRYRSIERDPQVTEHSVPLQRLTAPERQGTYTGTIPAQPAGRLLRFTVVAEDLTGATRVTPDEHDLRPTFSAFVVKNTNQTTVPQLQMLSFGDQEARNRFRRFRRGSASGSDAPTPSRGDSALLYLPAQGGPAVTFDHVRFSPRQGGWKIRLTKDAPLAEVTTWNLLFEGPPRWALAEALGYEVFRRLGAPTPDTDYARVTFNGRPLGYHLMVEQANTSFLRRLGHDPGGNYYKLLWYGQGLIGQHEKKNNPDTGHRDLIAAVNGLNRSQGADQWAFIQQHFNVETFINCYVGSMCLQNWDGFFNNYFVYHAPGQAGKWELIQWDLDKTWGDFDGASPDFDWYSMPLNYGANLDGNSRLGRQRQFGFGGWQRPPGYFSGPLLGNPEFRKRFHARLRVALDTVFSEPELLPVIKALEQRLEPEVRYRGQLEQGDGTGAVAEFRSNLDSFRRQLKHRRAFLLSELKKEP
jgi:hypothetical protein